MRSVTVLSALVCLGLCPAWGQSGQWQQQTKFSKDRAVALQNQSATINKRSIKIQNHQLHNIWVLFRGLF